jgi:hypothetical protein
LLPEFELWAKCAILTILSVDAESPQKRDLRTFRFFANSDASFQSGQPLSDLLRLPPHCEAAGHDAMLRPRDLHFLL